MSTSSSTVRVFGLGRLAVWQDVLALGCFEAWGSLGDGGPYSQ